MRYKSQTPETDTIGTTASDAAWVTMSFRVFGRDAELIHSAARAKNERAAGYMRRIILEWAAADTGAPSPDLGAYAHQDVVQLAAQRAGVSVREYTLRAAKLQASADLGSRIAATGAKIAATRTEIERAIREHDRKSAQSGERRKVGGSKH